MDASTILPLPLAVAIVAAALLILWSIWGDPSNLRAGAKVLSAVALAALGITSQLSADPPGWWTIAYLLLGASFLLWGGSIFADTVRSWSEQKMAELGARSDSGARADAGAQADSDAQKVLGTQPHSG
ncbi:MAG: hypothetical protein EA422_00945, partial [Gemmatimonadales bacterium]